MQAKVSLYYAELNNYGYFLNPWTEPELERLSQTLISTLHAGGWPYDAWTVKPEGIKAILRGQQVAPPGIWRYLIDGIERLRAATHLDGEEHKNDAEMTDVGSEED
jgi:hypothetical protein